jgi:hypothetical protein
VSAVSFVAYRGLLAEPRLRRLAIADACARLPQGMGLGSLLLGVLPSAGRLPRLLAGYAGGLALLTAAGLDAPLLAVAAPLAGSFLGPTLATLFGGARARPVR